MKHRESVGHSGNGAGAAAVNHDNGHAQAAVVESAVSAAGAQVAEAPHPSSPIASLSPDERVAVLQELRADVAALRAKAERLPNLTSDQRLHSNGKFKEQDDRVANQVVTAMEIEPAAFVIKKDGRRIAPDVASARADLSCRALSLEIAADLEFITQRSSDGALFFGGRARDVTSGAYPMAVELAGRNEDVAQVMNPALDANAAPSRARKNKQRRVAREEEKATESNSEAAGSKAADTVAAESKK